MKIRLLRGSLADAMGTVMDIAPTRAAIRAYLRENAYPADLSNIVVTHYGYDARVAWHTYIVMVDGEPCGFTDGPIDESAEIVRLQAEIAELRSALESELERGAQLLEQYEDLQLEMRAAGERDE